MIGILQIITSILLTYLYADHLGITFANYGIFKIILIFVILNVLFFLLALVLFIIFIYTTENTDKKSRLKHYIGYLVDKYAFSFLYRVNLKVSGKENLPKNNNFVVYSNHIEFTDPLYVMQAYKDFSIAFVAKEPLFKIPILKNLLNGMGCIPISRFAGRQAMNAIVTSIKQVKEGQPMGIFPEGKRTYKNELIEFKPGAFKLAMKAKADISPVCLYDMHKLAGKFRLWPTKVYLKILPIIKYEDYKDLETTVLAKKVYDMIYEALQEFKQANVKNN